MADNKTADAGAGGATFATDEIAGVDFPRIKLIHGADGVNDGDVSTANPFPVDIREIGGATVLVGGGVEAASLRVTIASDSTGVLSVDDNGGALTVDNAGTFAVQVDGAALTALQLIDNVVSVVDGAAGSTPTGVLGLATRDDALSALTPVEGDFVGLRVDANGALWVIPNGTVAISASSLPLPTGAATEASLAAAAASLATLDNAISGSEMQVDVVTAPGTAAEAAALPSAFVVVAGDDGTDTQPLQLSAGGDLKVTLDSEAVVLGAGSASIGILGANSGVDIGDVTLNNGFASVTGGGVEATALRVTVASDSTGVLSVDDNGGALTVDNAGTFAVQESGAALTALQLIDNLVLLEDAVHGTGDPGVQMLAVQKTADGALAGTTGDYAPLQLDENGFLKVNIKAGAGSGGTAMTDDAGFTVGTTSFTPVGGTYRSALDPVDDGDAGALAMLANRILMVNLRDASGTEVSVGGGTQYDEDAAHSTGSKVTGCGIVRKDTAASLAGTDGDYTLPIADATGRLWVHDPLAEALLTTIDGDTGSLAGCVGGTELQVDVVGALPSGTNAIGKLAANSGVDIGDVDVLSIVPGTGATNLGKAVDSAGGATDTGVAPLAIRDDALSALTPIEGDYANLRVDANGALWVIPSGTVAVSLASVPSHAVTNAGTFAVQESGAALTALQLIDNLVLAEDAAHQSADPGVQALAVRKATPANLSTADGDYEPLQVSAGRLWASATIDAALPAGTNNIGDVDVLSVPSDPFGANADAASATGSISAKLRFIASTGIPVTGTVTVGSHAVTNAGTFAVQVDGSALTALQLIDDGMLVEDAAAAADPTGMLHMAVRDDGVGSTAVTSADGDATALRCNKFGALKVTLSPEASSEPKRAIIDAAASGDNTLVAAAGASIKIRVLAAFLVAAGTVNVRFESGASGTALTGQMNLVANTGFVLPFNPHGWFETAANTLLNLELSAAISVDGCLTYEEVT